jgi:hypothetical protein
MLTLENKLTGAARTAQIISNAAAAAAAAVQKQPARSKEAGGVFAAWRHPSQRLLHGVWS